MNRLQERLEQLRQRGGKAFIAFLMAGEPNWPVTVETILELERIGVTAVELGVPFSDPIADGPVIQAAANRALAAGVSLEEIFRQVALLRKRCRIPLLLMGYWNVFLSFGPQEVLEAAGDCGADGFIVVDLPPEEEQEFFQDARRRELCTVLLACAQTRERRLRRIAEASTGFIYYVPQLGITGQELREDSGFAEGIERIRALTETPVCIGIGVKTRRDVQRLTRVADGVVVGTRIVDFIDQNRDKWDLPQRVGDLVQTLLP